MSPLKDMPWIVASNQGSFQPVSKQNLTPKHPMTSVTIVFLSAVQRNELFLSVTFILPNSVVSMKNGEPELRNILFFIHLASHSV